jgi:GNAT superfamily N-acetyltransferase
MTTLRRLDSTEARDERMRRQLERLLVENVDGGASIGFLAPLQPTAARAYWDDVVASLGEGRVLWVAEDAGDVVGSVQLAPCLKENGRHRAEVQKLFVLPSHRSRGIARRLMEALETHAIASGLTLLVLDTEVESPAEHVYRRLGWTRYGEVPNYALTPAGTLHATACYYKTLDARGQADARRAPAASPGGARAGA